MNLTHCPTCGSHRVTACLKTLNETVKVGGTHYLLTKTWQSCDSCGATWDLHTERGVGFTFEGPEKKKRFTSLAELVQRLFGGGR